MAPSSTQHIVPGTLKAPVHFTDGPVTLDLFEDYSEHCKIYLREYHNKVPANAVLPKHISGIECKKLHNAYLLDRAAYNVMTLNNFLNALRQHSFGPDWAINQAQKIKTMKQDGQPINQWFVNVFTVCHILTGLLEEIKDPKLITFLVDAMDPGLCQALSTETHELSNKIKAGTTKADDDETFAKWHSLINKTDQQIRQNDVCLLELIRAKILSFSQSQTDFQSNAPSSSYQQFPPCPSSSAAALPGFPPAFVTQNPGFVNAIAAQHYKLSAEELFMLVELTHGCLKCLMPFQNHISRSGLCDSPALVSGMPGYQPHDMKWVNEWIHLNPTGFKNWNAGAPSAAPCVPYTIMPDTIHCGIECAQGRGHLIPLCFLANNISTTSGTPVVHINLPQLLLPSNYAAPIIYRHDFPPRAPS